MQLLIILALLLYGGKANAQSLLTEVKPVLESIGGEEMKQALKSAEEISSVLNAVKDLTAPAPQGGAFSAASGSGAWDMPSAATGDEAWSVPAAARRGEDNPAIAFPLAPVSDLADRQITYSLSRYVSEN